MGVVVYDLHFRLWCLVDFASWLVGSRRMYACTLAALFRLGIQIAITFRQRRGWGDIDNCSSCNSYGLQAWHVWRLLAFRYCLPLLS